MTELLRDVFKLGDENSDAVQYWTLSDIARMLGKGSTHQEEGCNEVSTNLSKLTGESRYFKLISEWEGSCPVEPSTLVKLKPRFMVKPLKHCLSHKEDTVILQRLVNPDIPALPKPITSQILGKRPAPHKGESDPEDPKKPHHILWSNQDKQKFTKMVL